MVVFLIIIIKEVREVISRPLFVGDVLGDIVVEYLVPEAVGAVDPGYRPEAGEESADVVGLFTEGIVVDL